MIAALGTRVRSSRRHQEAIATAESRHQLLNDCATHPNASFVTILVAYTTYHGGATPVQNQASTAMVRMAEAFKGYSVLESISTN
jgi:hypothetical protein